MAIFLAVSWWMATIAGPATASTAAAQAGGQPLIGTFRITQGACTGGAVSGSTFRMVVPTGAAGGPYVSNNDSTCSDHTYTILAPGSDGGLVTGTFQSEPNPPFDNDGNSLAKRITKPAVFYGVQFSTSTNQVDPQTGSRVAAPSLAVQDGKLVGDLRAFAASWNRQEFNQGAPKPDGSRPGNTAPPTGTYDASTGAFTVSWASQIQGGPFNNFTGYWHLEGTFTRTEGTTATTSAPSEGKDTSNAPPDNRTGGTTSGSSGGFAASSAGGSTTTLPSGQTSTDGATATSAPPTGEGASNEDAAARNDTAAAHHRRSRAPLAVAAVLTLVAAAAAGWYGLTRRRHAAP